MSIEILENNFWKLAVHPRLGASPVALEAMANGAWRAVMRPTNPALLEGENSANFSSYNLAPYSNRIKNNTFVFEGREYHMKPNWADGLLTIHGDIRNRPLDMTRQENALEFFYDSRTVTDSNYPFSYTFKTRYSLEGDLFVSHLELQNVGAESMPAGLGYHPYFMPTFSGSSAAPKLQFQAKSVYLTDTTRIPDGGSQAIPPELDFSSSKAVTGFFIDNVYNGWDGVATFEWTGSGYGLRIEGDPIYTHFVVFNGDPDGTVALEPVSHCTDGFNLMAQGIQNTGVKVLAPGEVLAGAMRLTLEKLP